MSTDATQPNTGDVIEVAIDGIIETALVLLASDDMVILDLCDGEVPLVFELKDLHALRVFHDFADEPSRVSAA
jgi:hypothetical protein